MSQSVRFSILSILTLTLLTTAAAQHTLSCEEEQVPRPLASNDEWRSGRREWSNIELVAPSAWRSSYSTRALFHVSLMDDPRSWSNAQRLCQLAAPRGRLDSLAEFDDENDWQTMSDIWDFAPDTWKRNAMVPWIGRWTAVNEGGHRCRCETGIDDSANCDVSKLDGLLLGTRGTRAVLSVDGTIDLSSDPRNLRSAWICRHDRFPADVSVVREWTAGNGSHESTMILLHAKEKSWFQWNDICRGAGYHIATFDSLDDMMLAGQHIRESDDTSAAWLGYRRDAEDTDSGTPAYTTSDAARVSTLIDELMENRKCVKKNQCVALDATRAARVEGLDCFRGLEFALCRARMDSGVVIVVDEFALGRYQYQISQYLGPKLATPRRKVSVEQAQWYCLNRGSVLTTADTIAHEQSRRLLEQVVACHEEAALGNVDISACVIHQLPRDDLDHVRYRHTQDRLFSTWLCRTIRSDEDFHNEAAYPAYCSQSCSNDQPCFFDSGCSDEVEFGCSSEKCRFCSGSDEFRDIPCP